MPQNATKGFFPQPDDGRLCLRDNEMRVKIPTQSTNRAYEICEERCPPGFESRRHMHTKDFETFYMIDASATWEVGDETIEATEGATINIPPNVPHKVVTRGGCHMLVVFGPGEQSAMFSEIEKLTPQERQDTAKVHPILARHNLVPLE